MKFYFFAQNKANPEPERAHNSDGSSDSDDNEDQQNKTHDEVS